MILSEDFSEREKQYGEMKEQPDILLCSCVLCTTYWRLPFNLLMEEGTQCSKQRVVLFEGEGEGVLVSHCQESNSIFQTSLSFK